MMNIKEVDLRTIPGKREYKKWVHSIRRGVKSVSEMVIDRRTHRNTDSISQSENIYYSSKRNFYLSLAWRTKTFK